MEVKHGGEREGGREREGGMRLGHRRGDGREEGNKYPSLPQLGGFTHPHGHFPARRI